MGAMVIDRNQTRVCAREQLRALPGGGTGESGFQSVGDHEGRSCLQAVLERGRTRSGCCAIWAAPRAIHGNTDPPGAAALGHRRAHQALPSAGTGQVHGRRCGAPGRDRRPARHALGTRHPALAAARRLRLRGHPHCAAGQERRRGAQVLRRQPSAALCNVNQRLLRHIPQPLAQLPATPACSPRTLGQGERKEVQYKVVRWRHE